ncbi:MAG: alpha/beta hydrolase [Solobacterium sp.]|jgi:fermentation-respiration switch protein FrsA (DUF1100 family)|nr:alpha/beta hydrolase [Solobacterium sp.]MCH4222191.1 alpha/beta hydrolase [Solobacterium sp.]MCH4266427.1 alpha/beta hydrolase [Solobacterium sp.]
MSEEKKNSHPIIKAAAATAAVGTAAYFGFSYYVFRDHFDLEHAGISNKVPWNRSGNQARNDSWLSNSVRDEEYLDSYDGLHLHALRITNHADCHKWMIAVHGCHSCGIELGDYLYEFDQQGFNLLVPDQRGCGMSRGRYTGLGWPEHYDLISWINYLVNVDPLAEIVLFGVSFGATTVMYACGDYLCSNVKCAVEDCGCADINAYIEHNITEEYSVPGKPFMAGVDFFVKQNLHYSLNDVSVSRQLSQSHTPMLFIHGEADTIIPASMVYDCYYSCAAPKELFTAPGCGHAMSYTNENYFTAVMSFISKYMK